MLLQVQLHLHYFLISKFMQGLLFLLVIYYSKHYYVDHFRLEVKVHINYKLLVAHCYQDTFNSFEHITNLSVLFTSHFFFMQNPCKFNYFLIQLAKHVQLPSLLICFDQKQLKQIIHFS